MATTLLVVAAWVVVSTAVIVLARALGRVSTRQPEEQAPEPAVSDNVVALVPRGRNELARGDTPLREAS